MNRSLGFPTAICAFRRRQRGNFIPRSGIKIPQAKLMKVEIAVGNGRRASCTRRSYSVSGSGLYTSENAGISSEN